MPGFPRRKEARVAQGLGPVLGVSSGPATFPEADISPRGAGAPAGEGRQGNVTMG